MYYLNHEAFTCFCLTCILINTVVELSMKRGIVMIHTRSIQLMSKDHHVLHFMFLTAGLTARLTSLALHVFCFVFCTAFHIYIFAMYFIKGVTRSLILYSFLYLTTMMTTKALIVWNMRSTWMCNSETDATTLYNSGWYTEQRHIHWYRHTS